MREPLDPDLVSAALVTSGQPWRSVEFHAAIGSTNDRAAALTRSYAAELAPDESPLWRVVLTDDQTGGRGRLGRSWQVPPRASIAVSAIVPAPSPAAVGWVPLLAGVALVRGIRAVAPGLRATLKWPNDVLLPADDDRKVAGILCELVTFGDGEQAVVIGAGANVDQGRDELPVDTATSLRLAGADVRREDLVIAYLTELSHVLPTPPRAERVVRAGSWAGGGREDVREEYRSLCATVGSDVEVHLPSGAVAVGRATRVDDSGALVVRVAGTEQAFAAGDVVHVRRGSTAGLPPQRGKGAGLA